MAREAQRSAYSPDERQSPLGSRHYTGHVAAHETETQGPRVRVLGPVLVDGAPVAGPLPRRLIAALAIARPRALSSAALVDAVWGDAPPANARGALQTLVSRSRAVVGQSAIELTPAGYRLEVQTDLDEARAVLSDGSPSRQFAPESLDAMSLWHGEAGDDLGDSPVAVDLQVETRRLRHALMRQRAEQLGDAERWDDAAAVLEGLAAADPLDEATAVALMTALDAAGRRTEALAAFARLRSTLAETLGADPGDDAVALNTKLLRAERHPPRHRIGVRSRRSPLIGRDDDIRRVETSVAANRLTTILGVGGLGKTSLAHAVAERSMTPLTAVVELAGATNPDDVLITVTTTLGIRTVSSVARLADPLVRTDLKSRAIAALAERDTLLVLDNCEHLVDAAADLADDLLAAVPTLRVLATSRAPLAIEGEQVIELPALAVMDAGAPGPAVDLFIQRARAVRPDAELPLDAVQRVCASLDGLPLAIELAAARIRSLSLDDIERRLRDRFALLTTVDRSAPARHRTLFAVIDWSWKLLEPAQRTVLRRLALFADGFTADAAAQIAGDGHDVIDDLDALVMQSLVQVRDDGAGVRYRLLETVGEFARDRLDEADERRQIEQRYTTWVVDLALDLFDRLLGAEQLDALAIAVAERENIIAALRSAIARRDSDTVYALFGMLAAMWAIRGEHEEFAAFGADILPATEARDIADRVANPAAFGLSLLSIMFAMFGVRHITYPAHSRARRLIAAGVVTDARALILANMLGPASPDTDEGIADLFDHLDALSQLNDDARAACAALLGANAAENLGEIARAIRYGRTSYDRATALGDTWLSGSAAMILAQLYGESDNLPEAVRWSRIARDASTRTQSNEDMTQAQWMLSLALLRQGDPASAQQLIDELLDDATLEIRALLLSLKAELHLHAGDSAAAVSTLDESLDALPLGGRSAPWMILLSAMHLSTRILRGDTDAHSATATHSATVTHDDILTLTTRLRATSRVRRGNTDQPVIGAGLAALAAALLRDASTAQLGVDLLALADSMGCRRDFSALADAPLYERAAQLVGADAVEAARRHTASLTPLGRLRAVPTLLDRVVDAVSRREARD